MKKSGILRKCFVIAVSLTIIASELNAPILKSSTIVVKAETEIAQAVGINVAYHTEDEIREY